jgi:hypothetical protein
MGRSCFRHCTTSRKVAGSIPDGVIGIWYRTSVSHMLVKDEIMNFCTGVVQILVRSVLHSAAITRLKIMFVIIVFKEIH